MGKARGMNPNGNIKKFRADVPDVVKKTAAKSFFANRSMLGYEDEDSMECDLRTSPPPLSPQGELESRTPTPLPPPLSTSTPPSALSTTPPAEDPSPTPAQGKSPELETPSKVKKHEKDKSKSSFSKKTSPEIVINGKDKDTSESDSEKDKAAKTGKSKHSDDIED